MEDSESKAQAVRVLVQQWCQALEARRDAFFASLSKESQDKQTSFCLRFRVYDVDGGDWLISPLAREICVGVGQSPGVGQKFDCEFAVGAQDLLELSRGQLNPQEAVAQGKLLVVGGLSQVLRADSALQLLIAN